MRGKTRFGWLELIIGAAMIALGIYTLLRPNGMLTGVVRVYAVLAVISGARDIVFCCRTERYTGFLPAVSMISGIIGLMTGIMLLAYPNAGAFILSLLIPLWVITHSIFQLSSLPALKILTGGFHYYFSMVTSVIGLILGILMIFHPAASIAVTGTLVGLYLIITGINSIVIAFSKTGFYME